MKNEQISQLQFAQMAYPTIVSTSILFGPHLMGSHAKNDLWLSPVWAAMAGALTLYVALALSRQYPKLTFFQSLEQIIGTIPSKVLGFFYILLQLQINGVVIRDYTDFSSLFLMYTPPVVISATMILVCAMAVASGLETIGRAAQFFFPIFTLPLLVTILLVLKDLEPRNLLPVLGHGIVPTVRGALDPAAWFCEIFFLVSFFPFLNDQKQTGRVGMITIFFAMLTMVTLNIVTWMLLGDTLPNLLYPMVETAKYISIADFFENMESAIMAIWVVGVFVKLSVLFYTLSLSTAAVLGLHSVRPAVVPMGFLSLLFSYWGTPNFAASTEIKNVLSISIVFFTLFIPSLLLLFVQFRKRRGGKGAKSHE